MLVLLIEKMASCGMIYVPIIMKIGIGAQAILRFCFRNLREYNVVITDERDLMKYTVEMDSDGLMCVPSSKTIG
jgi:hypothetical protein